MTQTTPGIVGSCQLYLFAFDVDMARIPGYCYGDMSKTMLLSFFC